MDGASFASYASIRIRGAIVDYLRKSSNLCRTTIQIKKQYNAAIQKLERQLLRQPNRLEIADEMEIKSTNGVAEHLEHLYQKGYLLRGRR